MKDICMTASASQGRLRLYLSAGFPVDCLPRSHNYFVISLIEQKQHVEGDEEGGEELV